MIAEITEELIELQNEIQKTQGFNGALYNKTTS